MARRSMVHQFSQVPNAEIPRSTFDRSHDWKGTFDAGWLIPVFVDEALPGDTFNLRMTGFGRLATPIHPFMDNLYIDSFFFAIPERLLWDHWEEFNGAQEDPDDSTDYIMPTITSPVGGYANSTIFDYMGIPTLVAGLKHRADFLRAYPLVWNEWFRDQNQQDSLTVPKGDGPDTPATYSLQRRGKRHDYFTSALPWPQKGPAVELPLGASAPVRANAATNVSLTALGNDNLNHFLGTDAGNLYLAGTGTSVPLYADLSQATAATINSLRQAFQIQKLYERDARGGTRYTEIIRAHFGVTSPDARLQRPEYLGGGSSTINVNPIAQTSSTDGTSPQGNLAAQGTLNMNNHGFTKSFTEHCVILGLVSVRADLNYQQGLNRMWFRSTRWDFYWPALAHIGEQVVYNKEIYAQGTSVDEQAFGYQERFAEYRYKPSVITGQMRSNFAQTLDTWHLAQDFDALPVLGADFIVENPPVDRVIAVPTYPHILFDAHFSVRCARPMPVYSVPGLIDHF